MRPDFSLARHLEAETARTKTTAARVWFSTRALERARAESYATLVEEGRRDGGVEVTLYTSSLEWLARWLISFGAEAEAIAPVHLRALVRAAADVVARKHAG